MSAETPDEVTRARADDLRKRLESLVATFDARATVCRELHDDLGKHGDEGLAKIARAKATTYEHAAKMLREAMRE